MLGVRFRGGERYQRRVGDWRIGLPDNVRKALLDGGVIFERQAKRQVPVDTARLKASLTHTVEKKGKTLVGVVGTNVDYAQFTEFGTKNIRVGRPEAPRTSWPALKERGGRGQSMPWLRAAWLTVRDRVIGLLRKAGRAPGK